MAKMFNRARMTVTSTGTGSLTLGGATFGCQTFASAGVVNGDVVSYTIEDGANWEIGTGTYTSAGTTLSRTVTQSYNGTTYGSSPISVTTNAQVFITALAADLTNAANITSGTLGVANGGTGLSSLTAGYIPFGAGTSAFGSSGALFWNNSVGQLYVGTSSAQTIDATNLAGIQVHGTGGLGQFMLGRWDNNALPAKLIYGRSRSGVVGTQTAVQNGDNIFRISTSGSDGTQFVNAALIDVYIDGAPSTNSMPGRLVFSTTPSGGSASVERMRIDSSGNVGIGTSSPAKNLQVNSSGPTVLAITSSTTTTNSGPSFTVYNSNVSQGDQGGASFFTGYSASGTGYLQIFQNNYYGGFVKQLAYYDFNSNYWAFSTNGSERMRIDSSGRVGIGGIPSSQTDISIAGNATGNVTQYGVLYQKTTQSDVTGTQCGFTTSLISASSTFSLTDFRHFYAGFNTIGNSSIIGSQYGFIVGNLTGATNNYGFYSNIAAPTSGGTASSTVSTIASSSTTTTVVTTAAHGLSTGQTVTVSATAAATSLVSGATVTILTVGTTDFTLIGAASNTAGVSFTATGAGTGTGTVTINQQGSGKSITVVDTVTFTFTSTTGTYAAITAATGSVTVSTRFNVYVSGTANNYFNGNVGIGTTSPTTKLQLTVSPAAAGDAGSLITDGTRNLRTTITGSSYSYIGIGANENLIYASGGALNIAADGQLIKFSTGTAERMRIDSSGRVGIGTTPSAGYGLTIGNNITGATGSYGVMSQGAVQSDVTSTAAYYRSYANTAAASFTLTSLFHYYTSQGTFGAGSTVTNQHGFFVDSSFTGATNNYGFSANIASGTGRWNFYASGSANNAYAGNSRFGGVTSPVATVDVTGSVAATTTILSSGATSGIGYATGAGGAVTQATSRTTGVTLNNVSGAITLVSAAGSATYQTFTVTNSAVAATDTIIVNQKSGTDLYQIFVTNVAAGSFKISFATTGGTTTEQPVFNFAVIKAVAA